MHSKINSFLISALVLISFITLPVFSSEVLELHSGAGSVLKVNGNSTLHAYTIDATDFEIHLKEKKDGTWEVTMVLVVKSMTSGKKLLDKNMWVALQSERFSKISFTAQGTEAQGTETLRPLLLKGALEVAGISKEIQVSVSLQKNGEEWRLQGEKDLEMTDFNIQPPSFMMGVLKTENKIKILFDIHLIS